MFGAFYVYFARGFCAMGLGIIVAFILENVKLSRNVAMRILFTGMEIVGIVYLCFWGAWCADYFNLFRSFNYLKAFMYSYIAAGLFLFLVAQNAGYVSQFLNRQKWIGFISVYVYTCFVVQGLAMNIAAKWFSSSVFAFFVFDIVLGVLLYWGIRGGGILIKRVSANKIKN
jgi:hypothetical protein